MHIRIAIHTATQIPAPAYETPRALERAHAASAIRRCDDQRVPFITIAMNLLLMAVGTIIKILLPTSEMLLPVTQML